MNLGIYCAGGFGKEVYDVAVRDNSKSNKWKNIFFIDDFLLDNSPCYLTKVYSFSSILSLFSIDTLEIVIASGEPDLRKRIFNKVIKSGLKLGSVIDPTSIISPTAKLGIGIIVTSNCIIASNAIVGENVAINVKSIIGHDIVISDNVVLSSMVNIGGGCKIGEGSYLGMACLIREGVEIGEDVIIGMGSVVHNDIPTGMIALGNPARPMRRNIEKKVFK